LGPRKVAPASVMRRSSRPANVRARRFRSGELSCLTPVCSAEGNELWPIGRQVKHGEVFSGEVTRNPCRLGRNRRSAGTSRLTKQPGIATQARAIITGRQAMDVIQSQ